jgi:hypothetical protein
MPTPRPTVLNPPPPVPEKKNGEKEPKNKTYKISKAPLNGLVANKIIVSVYDHFRSLDT